jgi:hypothetical protein
VRFAWHLGVDLVTRLSLQAVIALALLLSTSTLFAQTPSVAVRIGS